MIRSERLYRTKGNIVYSDNIKLKDETGKFKFNYSPIIFL
jgi:hypothetical protein